MSLALETTVRKEVEGLHEFFVGWFSGALPENDFQPGFLRRFAEDFLVNPLIAGDHRG